MSLEPFFLKGHILVKQCYRCKLFWLHVQPLHARQPKWFSVSPFLALLTHFNLHFCFYYLCYFFYYLCYFCPFSFIKRQHITCPVAFNLQGLYRDVLAAFLDGKFVQTFVLTCENAVLNAKNLFAKDVIITGEKMNVDLIGEMLTQQLRLPESINQFQKQKPLELAHFVAPIDVVQSFSRADNDPNQAQRQLHLLVKMHRNEPHPLWGKMILLTFLCALKVLKSPADTEKNQNAADTILNACLVSLKEARV